MALINRSLGVPLLLTLARCPLPIVHCPQTIHILRQKVARRRQVRWRQFPHLVDLAALRLREASGSILRVVVVRQEIHL